MARVDVHTRRSLKSSLGKFHDALTMWCLSFFGFHLINIHDTPQNSELEIVWLFACYLI